MDALRTIVVAVLVTLFGGGSFNEAVAQAAAGKPKDGEPCTPPNVTVAPGAKSGSVQPRVRRELEPWYAPEPGTKTVRFANGELPITSTQFCDPKTRVYKTADGFPGRATRMSQFEYCTCTNPASVRLEPDLKYGRGSHIVCNGQLRCPPRPKK